MLFFEVMQTTDLLGRPSSKVGFSLKKKELWEVLLDLQHLHIQQWRRFPHVCELINKLFLTFFG